MYALHTALVGGLNPGIRYAVAYYLHCKLQWQIGLIETVRGGEHRRALRNGHCEYGVHDILWKVRSAPGRGM
jgi:hypothetical protein